MKKYISISILIILLLSIYVINISLARYEKNVKSDTITLGSIANTPITATITSVSDTDNTFDITVTNNNPYEVKYKIKEENDLYNVDYSGILNSYITIPANTTKTIRVVFSGKQDVIYEDMGKDQYGNLYKDINIVIDEDEPYNVNQIQIGTGIRVYLQKSIKNEIIKNAGEITNYEEGHIFTGISASDEGGLCSIVDPVSGETTYFFRGNVTNNYVSFAGYTWRILRINPDGSLRLVLNSIATNSQYKSTNTSSANNIDTAIQHIEWEDSMVYSALHTWYNNNIASQYSNYVVESNFVFDTSYKDSTSSSAGACYYFGTYLRVGLDGKAYKPTFSYTDESLVRDYIGLLTGDEILYAGGYWKEDNTSYFLYNQSINTEYWTMSPSFWDHGSHYKIGIMALNASGALNDWPGSGNTITENIGIRPVISIRGDLEMDGIGTASNPYKFKN